MNATPMNAATTLVVALSLTLLAVAPLRAGDGKLDASFNGVGYEVIDRSDHDVLRDMTVAGSSLFAVGSSTSASSADWLVARVSEDGSLATVSRAFDLGGSNADVAEALVADGQGGVVVAGIAEAGGRQEVEVCRFLTATLGLDTSFGTSGCTEFDSGVSIYFDVTTIAKMPDDSGYVVAGTINDSSTTEWYALRLTASGQVDTSYGFSGIYEVLLDQYSHLQGMAVGSNGETLLVGIDFESDGDHMAFVMLDGSGFPDSSFGNGGKEVFGSPANSVANCAAFDGARPFAVGISVFSSNTSTGAAYGMDSIGDLFYGLPSDVTWDEFGTNVPIRILPQGDGSLLVASEYEDQGLSGQVFAGTRFPCVGCSADTSYGTGGLAKFHPAAAGLGDGALESATLWGGRLVEGGYVTRSGLQDWVIVRFASASIFADNWETGDRRRWSSRQP